MPAPSPARGSAPTAPRCSRLSEDGQRVLDDLVRFAALDVGNEADAAGILFLRRIEEAKTLRAHRHFRAPPARGRYGSRRGFGTSSYLAPESSSGARGRAFLLEATFVPPGGLGCFSAAVRRALALGGWPCASSRRLPIVGAMATKLGQQYCPIGNMANSGRQHKSATHCAINTVRVRAARPNFRAPVGTSGPRQR